MIRTVSVITVTEGKRSRYDDLGDGGEEMRGLERRAGSNLYLVQPTTESVSRDHNGGKIKKEDNDEYLLFPQLEGLVVSVVPRSGVMITIDRDSFPSANNYRVYLPFRPLQPSSSPVHDQQRN